jgi:putative ABC transport system permease protein
LRCPSIWAHELSRGIGDTITIRLGDDVRLDLRIVALLAANPGYESIVLPADTLAAHTTSGSPSEVLVRANTGADPDALVGSLRRLSAGWPGVEVADRSAALATFVEHKEIEAWVNDLLVGTIVAYAAISLVNTVVVATGERRGEFGVLRLVGATRRQVIGMMGFEAALAAVAGILLGTIISATTLIPFSFAVSGMSLPSGPTWMYLVIVGTAAGLTTLSTLVPVWWLTAGSRSRERPA